MTAVEISRPVRLSEAVASLLSMLSAGNDGRLLVDARSRGGVGHRRVLCFAGVSSWVPEPILELLEDEWALAVALPVIGEGDSRPVRLGAVVASVAVPTIYVNPDAPKSTSGAHWHFNEPGLTDAARRLDAFLPATMLVGSGVALTGLWALRPPLDVRDESRALDLLRRLARAVGADVPGEDARLTDLAVPVPGGVLRELPLRGGFVDAVSLNANRAYSMTEIEAALAAAKGASK